MGKIINLEDRLKRPEFELPFIDERDLSVIKEVRARFSKIRGFEFLMQYCDLVRKGRNIITEDNIKENTLPFFLEDHIALIDKIQKRVLALEIGNIIKEIKDINKKEQLFHLRNKILQNNE